MKTHPPSRFGHASTRAGPAGGLGTGRRHGTPNARISTVAARHLCAPTALAGLLVCLAAGPAAAQVEPLPPVGDQTADILPKMDVGGVPEAAPVPEAPPVPEPRWYQRGYWLRPTTWDGGVELGLNGTEGNSQTFSLALGANAKRVTERNTLAFEATYVKSAAESVETANNAFLKGRHEWLLADSPWTLFVNGTLEYDEFRAFDVRLAGNGGVGYRLLKTDATALTGRFGSGVSHEIDSPDDSYVPEAVYGLDLEHQLTARQKVAGEANYYPSWEDYRDYRAETRVSWEVLLDEATNLSLKISATDRYDSTPHGRKPNDLDYALLLMWKL